MDKYIIIGIVTVFLLIVIYFLFFRKREEVKRKNNLYIIMKATGAIVEEYEINKIADDEYACNGFLDIIFGKNGEGGLDKIYEDITGKKLNYERFNCSGKTKEQIGPEIQKMAPYFNEMLLACLKNKDVKKRNIDLVSIWVTMLYGSIALFIPKDKFKFIVEKDGDNIKTIEVTLKAGAEGFGRPPEDTPFTPSKYILNADNSLNSNLSSNVVNFDIKNAATPLVDSAEINRLRTDTNLKITVDNLASAIIYFMSARGTMPVV